MQSNKHRGSIYNVTFLQDHELPDVYQPKKKTVEEIVKHNLKTIDRAIKNIKEATNGKV